MAGQPVKVLAWLMLAVLALGLLSVLLFEQGLRDVDNRSRFVVIPWIALWVCALRPNLRWLWYGALTGLLATFVMSLWQVLDGAPRADLFTNAIVLADIVMVLMVLLVFCRPSRRWSLVILGMAAGCGTIVLTGSRGVFAALLALLVVLALSLRWRTGAARLSVLAGMLAIGATLLLSVPELRHQVRLSELHSDVQRMELGDSDSSAGARVERLQVAWQTFLDHPLVGWASVISTARCCACRSAARTRKSCVATWGMHTTMSPNGQRPRAHLACCCCWRCMASRSGCSCACIAAADDRPSGARPPPASCW